MSSELTVQFTASNDFIAQVQRVVDGIAAAIRKFLQPIIDWFNSPQVRRFLRQLTIAAKRAGIVQGNTRMSRKWRALRNALS